MIFTPNWVRVFNPLSWAAFVSLE